ncbi:MAG TPA: SRPBCC domain-containing protein [Candidatus Elarobacter sp.]|jgi:uncharacterized protein YndB with AHSA1/START domain|nr:SRPBCC domain-containing protein [Candidatus Elarobacter sp.]
MTNTSTSTSPSLTLRHTYDAPRARVFEAWTKPEIAATFLGPAEVKATNITMDVREGGAYSITMLKPDGEELVASGTYREVLVPERLVMTWRWREDDPADEHETLLTLEFNEQGAGTELVLTHAQFASEESRDNHSHGWGSILDKLAALDLRT